MLSLPNVNKNLTCRCEAFRIVRQQQQQCSQSANNKFKTPHVKDNLSTKIICLSVFLNPFSFLLNIVLEIHLIGCAREVEAQCEYLGEVICKQIKWLLG